MKRGAVVTAAAVVGLACCAAGNAAGGEPGVVEVTLAGPPAADYRSDEPIRAEHRSLAAAVAVRWPQLRFSSRLADAAGMYADATRDLSSAELPPALVDFVIHLAGCPDITAFAGVVTASATDAVLDHADEVVRAAEPALTHVGLARVRSAGPGLEWRWGMVFSRRQARLSAFPSRVAPSARQSLVVEVADGLGPPWVQLVGADGQVWRADPVRDGDAWSMEVDLGSAPGTAWVEVLATEDGKEVMVAHFPVSVGVAQASTWLGAQIPNERGVDSVAEAEAFMVDLVNVDRVRCGLPVLQADPRLAEVARAHSTDMRDSGFFAHRSPTSGTHEERLVAAGYWYRNARENLARSSTVHSAQSALMASPGHRANLMAADVDLVGIGMVRDGDAYVVTQVFAQEIRDLSEEALVGEVEQLISKRRQGEGVRPLPRDPRLDEAASSLLPPPEDGTLIDRRRVDAIREQLMAEGSRWRSVRFEVMEVVDPDRLQLPAALTQLGFSDLGLAVSRLEADGQPRFRVVAVVGKALRLAAPERALVELNWQMERRREAAGLLPLEREDRLDRAAKRLAEAAVETGQVDAVALTAVCTDFGLRSGVRTVTLTVLDHDGIRAPIEVIERRFTAVGLGLARSERDDGSSVDTIVVLLAAGGAE